MPSTEGHFAVPMETAAAYAGLGLVVIPECAPTCDCNNPGKRPWDPIDHQHMRGWSQRGVPTRSTLESWADADAETVAAGQAPLNIGCLAGPRALGDDALIGADADGPRGIAEVAAHLGVEASPLAAALTEYRASGRFPLSLGTATYRTQSDGLRVLWRTSRDALLRTVGQDGGHNGLRLMWRGQQMVLPPSVGPDGIYSWLPGHSPWQVGIAPAPWSVLAAMQIEQTAVPAKPRSDRSPSAVPWPTVPACDGDLGPDSDGRLVPAAQLPYDQALLRDGLAQGARSEAVFALECDMLQAGWPPQAVVATLARQPWIQRMRPNIIGWLYGDVARARAFLPGRGKRADDARPRDHGDPASERMRTTGQALLSAPTPGAGNEDGADQRAPWDPVPDDAEGPDLYAREVLVDRAPHCWQCHAPLSAATHATCRRCGWLICACGACAEPCRAAEPGGHPARHRSGVRLRTFDPQRDAAVRAGLAAIRDASRPSQGTSGLLALTIQVGRMLGAFDRYRHVAWSHEQALRERTTRQPDGTGNVWGPEPCDVRGHEECAPFHAVRDLQPWRAALRDAYPTPVVAFALTAPGWGLRKTRKAAGAFLKLTRVRRSLAHAAGFLVAETFPQPGYAFHLLVPVARADDLTRLLLTAWRQKVPCGWLRRVDDLPRQASALEVLGELRVRSEQALALAVAAGQLEPERGARLLAEETAAGTRRGGQPQRLVLGPGMRILAQQHRQTGLRAQPGLAVAAGAESLVAEGPQTPAGQGPADPEERTAGRGSEEPVRLPAMEGADPGNAGGAPPHGPSATGSDAPSDDDDTGWVPCPWDPHLEMKPTRRRRVPWWEIERRVKQGHLVPILQDGRVVGFRTPPKRRIRP